MRTWKVGECVSTLAVSIGFRVLKCLNIATVLAGMLYLVVMASNLIAMASTVRSFWPPRLGYIDGRM